MVHPDIFEKLCNQDWKSIYPALVAYALFKIKKLKWRSADNQPPSGLKPEDIANDAIVSVYEGQRNWNPEKQPDLLKHLKSIVDSQINHLVHSSGHIRRVYKLTQSENMDGPPVIEDLQVANITPLEEVIAKDLLSQLQKDIKGDNILETILLCFEDGYYTPSDIAELFNLKIEDVNNGQKRLRRLAEKYRKEN